MVTLPQKLLSQGKRVFKHSEKKKKITIFMASSCKEIVFYYLSLFISSLPREIGHIPNAVSDCASKESIDEFLVNNWLFP